VPTNVGNDTQTIRAEKFHTIGFPIFLFFKSFANSKLIYPWRVWTFAECHPSPEGNEKSSQNLMQHLVEQDLSFLMFLQTFAQHGTDLV
jgi:hypothetical protein